LKYWQSLQLVEWAFRGGGSIIRKGALNCERKLQLQLGILWDFFSECLRGWIPVQSLGHSEAIELCVKMAAKILDR